jgi:hypothetical protein
MRLDFVKHAIIYLKGCQLKYILEAVLHHCTTKPLQLSPSGQPQLDENLVWMFSWHVEYRVCRSPFARFGRHCPHTPVGMMIAALLLYRLWIIVEVTQRENPAPTPELLCMALSIRH